MTRFTLRAVLVAACLLGTAAPLAAQVASTDLTAGAATFFVPEAIGLNGTTFTPDNPAALAWGTPSRIGVGALQEKIESKNPFGNISQQADGSFGGLRLVGENFAVAADHLQMKIDELNSQFEEKITGVQLSAQLGGFLALGIGGEDATIESPGNQTRDLTARTAGISLRLGEWFFLGYASEHQKVEDSAAPPGFTLERDVSKAGVAVRIGGDWSWYVEYWVLDNPEFESSLGSLPDSRFKAKTASLQTNIQGLLLGASSTQVEVPSQADRTVDIKIVSADLGWVPTSGPSLSARHTVFTQEGVVNQPGNVGPYEDRAETTSLTLAWMF
jgi:hypothetical protein